MVMQADPVATAPGSVFVLRIALLAKPADWLSGKIHPHALHLGIKLERILTHFASVARLLETAKRRSGIKHIERIDPDYPGFDVPGESMGAHNIAGPDAGGQTIDRVVGLLE